jgi:hypothetical protein
MDIPNEYSDGDIESFDYKFKKLQESRFDFSKKCNITPYETNDDNNVSKNNFSNEMLKSHLESTPLSKHFFSKCNLDHLQQLIIDNIYILSNKKFKIKRQSDKELLIIMRHIYLNEANNNDNNIIEQVNILNDTIIKKIIPPLLSNIIQHQSYLQKINNPLPVISHPVNVNSSNNKTTLEGGSYILKSLTKY